MPEHTDSDRHDHRADQDAGATAPQDAALSPRGGADKPPRKGEIATHPSAGSGAKSPQDGDTSSAAAGHQAVGIHIENLKKSYGKQVVLDGINLEIAPEETFVLMGPSGAGKSVLLRQVIGLEAPDEGRVLIDGSDASSPQTHEKIRSAMVFQAGALFNSMSVYDNLAFYPREHRLYNRRGLDEKVRRTLEILNLEQAADKLPAQLSGGMRKRVAIARALVMEPRLLLYDEPTSELDPVTSANIAEIIATLKNEFAVTSLVVSHDRDLALNIADRIALLDKGRLVTIDTPDGLRRSDNPVVREFLNPVIDPQHPRFRKRD